MNFIHDIGMTYELVLPWHVLLTIVYMFPFTYQFFELSMIPNTVHVFCSY